VLHLVEGERNREGDYRESTRLYLVRNPGGVDESVLITRDGQRLDVEHTIAPVRDERGRIVRLIIAFHDISQRRLANLQLARLANHDPLTGLLNRHAFSEAVKRALERTKSGATFSICQIDLDQFALVYHACGHDAAEDLLTWVGAMIREEVGGSAVVARMGGDVFAVLIERADLEAARSMAEALLRRFKEFHFTWADKTFPVSAGIGLIPVTDDRASIAEIFSAADHACVQAKRTGRSQLCICRLDDPQLAARQQDMAWVARIRKNLHEGNVFLYAQPIMPLASPAGDGLRFEVLLRVADEGGERVSPLRVIQAAERFGLMGAIDRWVIRHTLEALAGLPRAQLARLRLCCINLSSVSLHDPGVLEYIHQQLSQTRVPAQRVCFEITETAVVQNLLQARWLISELQAIGCRFALDDFGSGVASYAHLKDLPVNYLKIAGDFTQNVATSALDRAMVESIAQIGRVLNIGTIAEAVPDQLALDTVRGLGIDYVQGNFIGVPLPLAEVLQPTST
jgi:diguanylate cyclase (GGDEF)-like protein